MRLRTLYSCITHRSVPFNRCFTSDPVGPPDPLQQDFQPGHKRPRRSTRASAAAAIRSRDSPAPGLPCSLPRLAPAGRFGFALAGGLESALDFIFVIKRGSSNLLQPYTGRLYEEIRLTL